MMSTICRHIAVAPPHPGVHLTPRIAVGFQRNTVSLLVHGVSPLMQQRVDRRQQAHVPIDLDNEMIDLPPGREISVTTPTELLLAQVFRDNFDGQRNWTFLA